MQVFLSPSLACAILVLAFPRSAPFALVLRLAFPLLNTISSFRFNGALISSRSFCRSKFNFSRRAYMAQVLASLMTTMALRHAFDIPGGECRIQNVDESMCYSICLIAQSGLGQFELIHLIRKFSK